MCYNVTYQNLFVWSIFNIKPSIQQLILIYSLLTHITRTEETQRKTAQQNNFQQG